MAKLFIASGLKKRADESQALHRFLWRFEALLFGAFVKTSASMSPDRASALGRRLMMTLGPHLEKTRKFELNLSLAFPEKSPEEIRELTRLAWGNVGSVLAEFAHLRTITDLEAEQRCQIVTQGDLRVFKNPGTPAIFVQAHLGNWEVAPRAGIRLGVSSAKVLYTPIQNPWLDRLLRKHREALGCGLISIKDHDTTRQIMRHMAGGGSLGLVTDQRVDSGEPVPFFGHDMLTTTTPARLALRFKCELIPVRVERLEGARFRVTLHEPVTADPGLTDPQEKILQMTRRVNEHYEQWIRERPHEWLCSKRRWPKDAKPASHTTGKPAIAR